MKAIIKIILLLDPTQIDWGNEKEDEPPTPQEPVPPAVPGVASATQTFKCTALYSYTVRILGTDLLESFYLIFDYFSGPKS